MTTKEIDDISIFLFLIKKFLIFSFFPLKKIKSFILNSSRKTLVKFQLENEGTKVLFKR